MRHEEVIVKAAGQGVLIVQNFVIINAGELFGQGDLLDAVAVIQTRLSAPADEQSGIDMVLGPIEDLAQLAPVIDLFVVEQLHGRAGDDHAVKALLTDLVKGTVELGQMLLRGVLGHMGRHLQQLDIHLQRRVAEQSEQLGLGDDLGGHKVDDHDPERPDILSGRAVFGHDKDVLALENLCRRQIVRHFNRHSTAPFN